MKWFREHTRLATVIGVLMSLIIIIAVSFVNKGNNSWLGRKLEGGITQVQEPLSDAGNGVSNGFSGIFRFRSVLKENEKLKAEISKLNQQIIKNRLSELELKELRELSSSLNYVGKDKSYNHVTADVIALDGSNWFNLFTINAGTKDGVKKDSIVVGGDGLIGRVLEVGNDWAKIISLIDENSNVSFQVSRNLQLLGILSGDGKGSLKGYMLDPEASVGEGDMLLTSGIGIYPQGIPIGKVSSVTLDTDSLLKTLTIEPVVYFKNIQKVTVIIPD
ncbi:MAG: rod shape-determining protein MreC [Anaerovorax sp.]|nr:rod shape-determining protein MreC [Anaerovorax sp.]